MRRLQLFEFLDQSWFPRLLREGVTDCLEAIISRANAYRPVQEKFFSAIAGCKADRVTDLCSGGGGPWLSTAWRPSLASSFTVLLTDKFPSRALAERLDRDPMMHCVDDPVDATHVPENLHGFRTIFSSFHHFPDFTAGEVLEDAVRCGDGFAMAEVTSRTLRAFVVISFMPLIAWWVTPGIRPLRWSRLMLTYLLPVIPLVVLWDGWVSCCRTRTPEELLALTAPYPQYEWSAGYARQAGTWLHPVYLLGSPKATG